MSLAIDPKDFAKMTVMANPSNSNDPEEIAKESLELYLSAYKLAERYMRLSKTSQETSEILQQVKDENIKV